MIRINLYIRNEKVDDFLGKMGYHGSSLVCILKKEVGYKNGIEIEKKYNLLSSFLREKVYWKEEAEYKQILMKLSKLLEDIEIIPRRNRGKRLMTIYITSSGSYSYGYSFDGSINETLHIYQQNYIIRQWLLEKF